jgi:hypothetical protein
MKRFTEAGSAREQRAGSALELSGQLGLAAFGPASASSISGASSTDPNRSDRIGVGSGLFQFGQPRLIEWGLKLVSSFWYF